MRERQGRTTWKHYAVTAGIGLGLFLVLMLARGGFAQTDPAERWKLVSDAFFIPGALILAIGLLVWVADGGVFDMLKFGLMKAFGVIRSKEKRDAEPRTFYDYRVARQAKEPAPVSHLLIVGIVFVILGGVAVGFYAQYDPELIIPPPVGTISGEP